MDGDRRSNEKQTHQFMRAQLNDDQMAVVTQLEVFGWYLIFVRQPLGQSVVPVLKDPDCDRYVVLETGGTLIEDCNLITRH